MKLIEIKGLLPKRKRPYGSWIFSDGYTHKYNAGYNNALLEIGEREIELDVEKMAGILKSRLINQVGFCRALSIDFLKLAQSLSQANIIKVKEAL